MNGAATIFLNITHGFQARMLLRSEIARTLLARGARLVVCSPNSGEEYFQRELNHPQITLVPMPQRISRWEARLAAIRQTVLMNPALGQTLNYKREALRLQRPLRYWAGRMLNPIFGRAPWLRRAYMGCEAACFRGREYDALLAEHRPHLVVTGTPGYHAQDVHLLRAARRHGIPSATVMLSWDNLTSKGYMNAMPDHLLVWSELMADEAATYHDYPRERIRCVGAAQFDQYFQQRKQVEDRNGFCRRHELDSRSALIVYGTINPAICPHEIEIVRMLADLVTGDALARPAQLWVRLHPQAVRGVFRQDVEPYFALAGPGVRIEAPPVQSEALAWDLPCADQQHLAELLCAADVAITTSSTLSIDAACVDTPIVNVFFDGLRKVDAPLSTRRFMNYTHYAKLLQTGGIAATRDFDEFVLAVNRYLGEPASDRQGRQAIVSQQLGSLDGLAGRRTAEALLEIVQGPTWPKLAGELPGEASDARTQEYSHASN
jgi:hypothetical protein